MENENVMPAGAMPPVVEPEVEEVVEEVVEPEPILGKFKTQDDLATAYTELEKKIGEQGSELGAQKQMNTMLLDQVKATNAQAQVPATNTEAEAVDYDAQMLEISAAVENGNMPIEEALMTMAKMASAKATDSALSKYQELDKAQKQEATQQSFLDSHPDFLELQQSGELDEIKNSLPGMHDDFSAYFAYQADQATQAAAEKQEIDRIAAGSERADKVLQKPGNPQTQKIGKPQKRMSPGELERHTLAKLDALG